MPAYNANVTINSRWKKDDEIRKVTTGQGHD